MAENTLQFHSDAHSPHIFIEDHLAILSCDQETDYLYTSRPITPNERIQFTISYLCELEVFFSFAFTHFSPERMAKKSAAAALEHVEYLVFDDDNPSFNAVFINQGPVRQEVGFAFDAEGTVTRYEEDGKVEIAGRVRNVAKPVWGLVHVKRVLKGLLPEVANIVIKITAARAVEVLEIAAGNITDAADCLMVSSTSDEPSGNSKTESVNNDFDDNYYSDRFHPTTGVKIQLSNDGRTATCTSLGHSQRFLLSAKSIKSKEEIHLKFTRADSGMLFSFGFTTVNPDHMANAGDFPELKESFKTWTYDIKIMTNSELSFGYDNNETGDIWYMLDGKTTRFRKRKIVYKEQLWALMYLRGKDASVTLVTSPQAQVAKGTSQQDTKVTSQQVNTNATISQQVAKATTPQLTKVTSQPVVNATISPQVATVRSQQVATVTSQPVAKATIRQQVVKATCQQVAKATISEQVVKKSTISQQLATVTSQPVAKAASLQVAKVTNQVPISKQVAKVTSQQVTKATSQQVAKATSQQVSKATSQQVTKATSQQVTKATTQQTGATSKRQSPANIPILHLQSTNYRFQTMDLTVFRHKPQLFGVPQIWLFGKAPLNDNERIVILSPLIKKNPWKLATTILLGVTRLDPRSIQLQDIPIQKYQMQDNPNWFKIKAFPLNNSSNCNEEYLSYFITSHDFVRHRNSDLPEDGGLVWPFVNITGEESMYVTMFKGQRLSCTTVTHPRGNDGKTTGAKNPSNNGTRKEECAICSGNNVDAVLYKCGHNCMCMECAQKQWKGRGSSGQCPLCREPILDVIRLFQ